MKTPQTISYGSRPHNYKPKLDEPRIFIGRQKEYKHEWWIAHKDEIAEKARTPEGRKREKEQRDAYRASITVRKRRSEESRIYYLKNKEQIIARRSTPDWRARRNSWERAKRKNDLQYRLNKLLHESLSCRLKKNKKKKITTGNVVKWLGCTIPELIVHLESQFQEGMSWENHGKDTWHIDHIKPVSSFDLSDPVQFATAAHYTNLQPLWATENFGKGGTNRL